MITTNGNDIVFAGFFSMKAGEEVVISPPNLEGRVFRFTAQENASSEPGPSNTTLVGDELRLPIPLLQVGQNSMENPFVGMIGSSPLSLRCILQGAGLFTIVFIELYLGRTA